MDSESILEALASILASFFRKLDSDVRLQPEREIERPVRFNLDTIPKGVFCAKEEAKDQQHHWLDRQWLSTKELA